MSDGAQKRFILLRGDQRGYVISYFLDYFLPILEGFCEKVFVVCVEFFGNLVMFPYKDALSVLQLSNVVDVSMVHHCSVEEFCVSLALSEPLNFGLLPP
jgi:hypothetical protein